MKIKASGEYPNIYIKFDNDGIPISYLLIICRSGVRYSKTFNFVKFGSQKRSLKKALEHRSEVIKDINKVIAKIANKSRRYQKIAPKIYSANNVYYTIISVWEGDKLNRKRISISKEAFTEKEAIVYLLGERKKYGDKAKHFKDGNTKTEFESVYRYFDKNGKTIGFKVDFSAEGKRVCKCFNNNIYGGFKAALTEAVKYRDEQFVLLGLMEPIEIIK